MKLVQPIRNKDLVNEFGNVLKEMNDKYFVMFRIGVTSGLRISEAVNLRIEDIDSRKMRIFVREGKGKKERYTVLPKTSLEMLRKYYKMYNPRHPEGYPRRNVHEDAGSAD